MKSVFASLALSVAAILTSTTAVAQTRYCIGGDLDHLSSTERSACNATMQAVRAAATSMHAPEGWHFVVVCGEGGWKSYTAFSSRGEAALETAAADTDLTQGTTYLREDRLHTAQAHGLERGLERVVEHEVASIQLKSTDEVAIQAQMAILERGNHVQEALLRQ